MNHVYTVKQYSNRKPEHGTFHAYRQFDTYLISIEFNTLKEARKYFNTKMAKLKLPEYPCWIENEDGKVIQKNYHKDKK